jgi:hypothetical protein
MIPEINDGQSIDDIEDVASFAQWLQRYHIIPEPTEGRLLIPFGEGRMFAPPSAWGTLFANRDFVSEDDHDTMPLDVIQAMMQCDNLLVRSKEVCEKVNSLSQEVIFKVGAITSFATRVEEDTLPPQVPDFFGEIRKWEEMPDDLEARVWMHEFIIPTTTTEIIKLCAYCGVDGVEVNDGFVSINSQKMAHAGFADLMHFMTHSDVVEQIGGHTFDATGLTPEEREAKAFEVKDELLRELDDMDPDSDDNDDTMFDTSIRDIGGR